MEERIIALSKFVSTVFGGSITNLGTFQSRVDSAISEVKTWHLDQWVTLGGLIGFRLGVCRHRSILFKYLCDHMHRFPAQWGLTAASASASDAAAHGLCSVRGAIPCQLVRGVRADGTASENHMWNVVRLGNESFVVDVMQRPGQLLAADSKEAQAYQRSILAGAQNGAPVSKVSYHDGVGCCRLFLVFILIACFSPYTVTCGRQSRAGRRRASLDCGGTTKRHSVLGCSERLWVCVPCAVPCHSEERAGAGRAQSAQTLRQGVGREGVWRRAECDGRRDPSKCGALHRSVAAARSDADRCDRCLVCSGDRVCGVRHSDGACDGQR
jgi:hypothetical protein